MRILFRAGAIALALLCHAGELEARDARAPRRVAALTVGRPAPGHVFYGKASFYGRESGPRTASGARFNPNDMTCAHRSLPFGTRLRVSYRGRSVLVEVNDRGPFIAGRVLDLSEGAARALGMLDAGVGQVRAEVVVS